jgi:hypothetical protein
MEPHQVPQDTSHEAGLADDLLRGADEIAEFIFGARGSRRKIYYLAGNVPLTGLPVGRSPMRKTLRSYALDFRAGEPGKATAR